MPDLTSGKCICYNLPTMNPKGQKILDSVVDLVVGLWQRSDRDFSTKKARDAFRETCHRILRGEKSDIIVHPDETVTRDSAEWAEYVAFSDCLSVLSLLDNIKDLMQTSSTSSLEVGEEECKAVDGGEGESIPVKGRRFRLLNPSTDRRFKANKTEAELEKMQKHLALAREKASDSSDESLSDPEGKNEENEGVSYLAKRKRNSKPNKVPLPHLPTDYRLENEWIKKNIKSPDMLYSYVKAKAGDGIQWSSGMRRYYENNDFWEFAFDTLSSGGWCDSENNKPICNVSKYITKVIIGEYERHEASKHSRFEGKFKDGKELLDYINVHCYGLKEEYKTEAYCSWFLQKMNDIGWRWNNGATINNIPAQMSSMYHEFKEWCGKNGDNLAGLNPNQYGETLRIQNAIERGDWKPRANGKFCAMDLLKIANPNLNP